MMSTPKRTAAARIASSIVVAFGLIGTGVPAFAAPDTGTAAHGSNWNNGWNTNGNWNTGGNWNSGGGWNNGGGWNSGGGWNAGPQIDTVAIGVDRYVAGEILPLRQLGNIGPQYNGRTLSSVVVEVYPWGPPAEVQLLVNGHVVDARSTAGKQRVELRPGQADVFGQEIRTLQLRTVGYTSIDDIEVNILRQASWGPGPTWPPQPDCVTLERQLNTQIGFGQIDLNRLFDLGRYNGCRIGSVSFVGNTALGQGLAALRVNGVEASNRTQVAAYPGLYTLNFWNRPTIGVNAPQIALNLMGQFNVQSIRLNLVRN